MTSRLLLLVLILVPMVSFSQLSNKNVVMLRKELSERINQLRESKGLEPLVFNSILRKTAEFHSDYMARKGSLSHYQRSSRYKDPKKRVLYFGGEEFNVVAENILCSSPQKFPLRKKAIIALADEMFNNWKNSPYHYLNMTEPEFIFGDLGFKTNRRKKTVYVTHVFGTKGYQIKNQLSTNAFQIRKGAKNCETKYYKRSNSIVNLGNGISIRGNEVILSYYNISNFKKIFPKPNDGIAIDLISEDQLKCGSPNQLDSSPIYDGILLKPYFSGEILENNEAIGDYRVITKVGDIPDNLLKNKYSPAIVIIKEGRVCKYFYPISVPSKEYELRSIEPMLDSEPTAELIKQGVVHSQVIDYDFETSHTTPIELPKINRYNKKVHSVVINSYSSVEGDSTNNVELHISRANFIKRHIGSTIGTTPDLFTIKTKENWEQMNFQLNYFKQEKYAEIPRDSFRLILANRDDIFSEDSLLFSLSWDSLLFSQRKSTATINYLGEYKEEENPESFEEFNLRTAIATQNVALANRALYEMYQSKEYEASILYEPNTIEFIKEHPETVANFAALLSTDYYRNSYLITDFIHSWLNRIGKLNDNARFNLLHLYTKVGTHLLNTWDVSAERLANVIHPSKIKKISSTKQKTELLLNLHLTFIKYYDQINDRVNTSKSFDYTSSFFKKNRLNQEDDINLALFYNFWSAHSLTVAHLLKRFQNNELNEEGLFILAMTMSITEYANVTKQYYEVNEKAIQINKTRWCRWVDNNFQIKRNYQIKRLYCNSCQ